MNSGQHRFEPTDFQKEVARITREQGLAVGTVVAYCGGKHVVITMRTHRVDLLNLNETHQRDFVRPVSRDPSGKGYIPMLRVLYRPRPLFRHLASFTVSNHSILSQRNRKLRLQILACLTKEQMYENEHGTFVDARIVGELVLHYEREGRLP